jgi:multiple sugar transport system permease protein
VAATVPLFLLYQRFQLMDTRLGLVLLYSSFFVSFAVLMMKAFFDEVPIEIDEAAMIDGAGRLRVLLTILLPVVAPGTAATAIFAFISSWNEFFFALVFTSGEAKTAPVALASFVGEAGVEWGTTAAGATTVMLPSLLLIWGAQRYLVRGLVIGAVK